MKYLLLLLLTTISYAEDNYTKIGEGVIYYTFTEAVSQKRFLAVVTDHGVAVIEAPAAPIAPKPEPITAPEKQYWDTARSYSFGQAQKEKGWECVSTGEMLGRKIYHLRRKNPNYKGPALEDAPLEK